MFQGDQLVKPQKQSIIAAAVIALLAFVIQHYSAWGGYLLAMTFLLNMIVASLFFSFWPTRKKKENMIVFGLFWGLLVGLLLPFGILELISNLKW